MHNDRKCVYHFDYMILPLHMLYFSMPEMLHYIKKRQKV